MHFCNTKFNCIKLEDEEICIYRSEINSSLAFYLRLFQFQNKFLLESILSIISKKSIVFVRSLHCNHAILPIRIKLLKRKNKILSKNKIFVELNNLSNQEFSLALFVDARLKQAFLVARVGAKFQQEQSSSPCKSEQFAESHL